MSETDKVFLPTKSRLFKARKQKKYDLGTLADHVNMDINHISTLDIGTGFLRQDEADKIASLLKQPRDFLFPQERIIEDDVYHCYRISDCKNDLWVHFTFKNDHLLNAPVSCNEEKHFLDFKEDCMNSWFVFDSHYYRYAVNLEQIQSYIFKDENFGVPSSKSISPTLSVFPELIVSLKNGMTTKIRIPPDYLEMNDINLDVVPEGSSEYFCQSIFETLYNTAATNQIDISFANGLTIQSKFITYLCIPLFCVKASNAELLSMDEDTFFLKYW